MWLLQQCREAWAEEGKDYSYAELAKLAEEAPAFRSLVNPDDPVFLRPQRMPAAIADFCRGTDQPAPETPGEFARCIVESLGLLYDFVLGLLEQVTGKTIRVVHVVGGGSQNRLLNQITADATGREVKSGPVEATAIGNVLLQALALGQLGSLEELRSVVAQSFPTDVFRPREKEAWVAAKERFRKIHAAAR
jgi:rhamnulokinase